MNVAEMIVYLRGDPEKRVSLECGSKQAAEVAQLLAEYAAENTLLTDEFNAMLDERDAAIRERDALKTEVERLSAKPQRRRGDK